MKVWYTLIDKKIFGPFSKEDVLAKIQKGVITPSDFLSCGTTNNWKHPTEWSVFKNADFPCWQLVDEDLLEMNKLVWIILVWNQFEAKFVHEGPYSTVELKTLIFKKRIDINTYIWKPGLTAWVRAKHRPELRIGKNANYPVGVIAE